VFVVLSFSARIAARFTYTRRVYLSFNLFWRNRFSVKLLPLRFALFLFFFFLLFVCSLSFSFCLFPLPLRFGLYPSGRGKGEGKGWRRTRNGVFLGRATIDLRNHGARQSEKSESVCSCFGRKVACPRVHI